MLTNNELERLAVDARKKTLEVIYTAGRGHIGGSLSSVDILINLHFSVLNIDPFNVNTPARDRFIMSKGHSVEAYYVVLAMRGFIDEKILGKYGMFDSPLAGHPINKIPGIEINSGSLGHGLSVGVGMALAAKSDNLPYRVFVLMGDGEHGEGSIMEAVTAANHYNLDNLTAIVDKNQLQLTGPTENVMAIGDLAENMNHTGGQ
jgi:transketolase